ncbi:hypothetical protein JCM11641_002758 [Rhodosporidiobolus odoratus]
MLYAARALRQTAKLGARQLHASRSAAATSNFLMPAMSPTMTEGSLSEWKVKEGEAFAAGDVLLSLETDKATIDVEAQDDGVMGKILVQNGAAGIPVGQLIAILAEEGDDLAAIEVPSETSASSSAPSASDAPSTPSSEPTPSPATPSSQPSEVHAHPHHDKPLLPSVLRLLAMNNVSDASAIVGTGHHGILTKGDVLAFLGKISNPRGSLPEDKPHGNHPANEYTKSSSGYGSSPASVGGGKAGEAKQAQVHLDGPSLRRIFAAGLGVAAKPKSVKPAAAPSYSFDSILDDYLPLSQRSTFSCASSVSVPPPAAKGGKNSFDDILGL